MKKVIFTIVILFGLTINGQEIMTDWEKLDGAISLMEYIESNSYKYLNFNPTQKDTISAYEKIISENSSDTDVVIRCVSTIPKKPLVVINDYPIVDEYILTIIRLNELNEIRIFKADETTWALYGSRSEYGVIIINIDKRKWKKINRKYGR